jgi:hypothetical protein
MFFPLMLTPGTSKAYKALDAALISIKIYEISEKLGLVYGYTS